MNELALFAGAGGGILGGRMLGWRTVCAVERDAYAAQVLVQRQNDGSLEPFPIWSDVQSFDGIPWRGIVDVVSGGFPCQDISVAGKGAGIDGERSGLWSEFARVIGEVRPRYVFVENSPALITRGLGRVLADLSTLGFDAEWGVISAADVGANHRRERIWIVAHFTQLFGNGGEDHSGERMGRKIPESGDNGRAETLSNSNYGRAKRWEQFTGEGQVEGDVPNSQSIGCLTRGLPQRTPAAYIEPTFQGFNGDGNVWGVSEPGMVGMADAVAHRVDRIRAIGNGQVPLCAATAWRILRGGC